MSIKRKLQVWLHIEKSKVDSFNEQVAKDTKEFEKKAEQVLRDLDFWHRTFRSFSVVPCAYCKKQMRIYPYGGAYYLIKDNQKVHTECYEEYLKGNKKLKVVRKS